MLLLFKISNKNNDFADIRKFIPFFRQVVQAALAISFFFFSPILSIFVSHKNDYTII